MMECNLVPHGREFKCSICGKKAARICRRRCRLGILQSSPPCSFAHIVSRLTPAGSDRLQRCRSAECKLMLPVDGSIRCVGMPGSKCQWIAEWAKRLNDPEWVCPHWLSSSQVHDS